MRISGGGDEPDLNTLEPEQREAWYRATLGNLGYSLMKDRERQMTRVANSIGARAILEADTEYRRLYSDATEAALEGLKQDNIAPLLEQLAFLGFSLLKDNEIFNIVQDWWLSAKSSDKTAGEKLRKVLKALQVGPGRTALSSEEREAIINDCEKLRPICKGLNRAFKKLWKEDRYQSSEPNREEMRDSLAKEIDVPIEDVKAIESYLKTPSGGRNKSTPTQAMCRMVARRYLVGEKTVEQIWEDYRQGLS